MRPCLTTPNRVLKASLAISGGSPWFAVRSCSAAVTTSTQAVGNSANDWEKDLADVLREPEGNIPKDRADKPLQAWQISKLQAAAAAGRRKVKVNDLAHELQLPRPEVLKFLKANVLHTDRPSKTAQAAEQRTNDAQSLDPSGLMWDSEVEQRDQNQHQSRANVQQEAGAMPQPKAKKAGPSVPFVERQRQGSDFENKRLGRAVEATLERLYEESRRPSDDMLQSVLKLHKGVPRKKLVDWFGQRRRMDATMRSDSQRQQHKQHS
ncbi:hypothetical protein WJX77_000549 [Trebouxia sp. C0004]